MEGFNYNEYKNRTRGVESGGNDRAKNPNSSASGRFQFTKDTWKRYGYNWKDRFNPQLQEEAMKRFTEDNINYFKNTFKKEPSYADAYGMHFLGAGGYRKVYTAPDNTPIQEVVSEGAYSSNKSVFSKYRTVGEFKGWLSSKAGQPTSKYSGQENNETSTYKEVSVPNVTMEGKTAEPYMTLPPSEKAEEAKKQIQEYQQVEDLISQMPIAQEEQVIQEVQPQTDYSYLTNQELFTLSTPQFQQGGRVVNVEKDNRVTQYNTNSQEYRELYNTGNLATYDKNTDTYLHPPMDELEINVEAPDWLKYQREYERNNPKSEYIDKYLTPLARGLGNTKSNYPQRLDREYEEKMLDFVSEQIIKNKPQGKRSRVEYLNSLTKKEEELVKRNPKYQTSYWEDAKRGLQTLTEDNLAQTLRNITDSKHLTSREKQALTQEYIGSPNLTGVTESLKVLSPLTIPSKAVQSTYKEGYSFSDAIGGVKNDAGIVEDIVTDPLNLVGAGLVGKLSKADKVIDVAKAGSKVLNKEGKLNKLTELELLTEKEIAQKRANRLLAQKNKWVGQDDKLLEEQLKNAGKNHENNLTAQEFNIKYNSSISPSNIGINKEGETFIFKDAPLTELNKKRVAAHEVGHYYRNTLEEGLEWDKYFDFTGISHREKKYLRGKGLTGNGSVKGDELRERAAQLKDFIAVKNNIPLDKDFVITPSQFDDALKNYVKETGLDNNMETFIKAIKNKKGLLKEMNKKALGIAPAVLYMQSKQTTD